MVSVVSTPVALISIFIKDAMGYPNELHNEEISMASKKQREAEAAAAAAAALPPPTDPKSIVNVEFFNPKMMGSLTMCLLLLHDGTVVLGYNHQDAATYDFGKGQALARTDAEAQIAEPIAALTLVQPLIG